MTQNALAQTASDPKAIGVPGVLTGKLLQAAREACHFSLYERGRIAHRFFRSEADGR